MSKMTRLVPAAFCVLLWPIVGCETSNFESQLYDPLPLAVKNGDTAKVKELLAQGADPSEKHAHTTQFGTVPGLSAFEEAMVLKNDEIMKLLIAKCVETYVPGKNCASAKFFANNAGDTESVKTLLSKRTDLNAPEGNGLTALTDAAAAGNMEIVKFLIEKGADLNALDGNGNTALGNAASTGKKEMIQFLLSQRADINKSGVATLEIIKGAPGLPPLAWAVMGNSSETAKLLLAKGANAKTAQSSLDSYRTYWDKLNNPAYTSTIKEASRLLAELSEK